MLAEALPNARRQEARALPDVMMSDCHASDAIEQPAGTSKRSGGEMPQAKIYGGSQWTSELMGDFLELRSLLQRCASEARLKDRSSHPTCSIQ